MIPYIEHPTIDLGFYQVQAFTVLALIAVFVQFQLTVWRAPHFGIDRRTASSLVAWAICLGLIGAHIFDVIAYTPELLAQDPLVILKFWGTLSSMGGMLGGLLGVVLVMKWKQISGAEMLRFVDCLIFALPFTLAIGRLGCGLQHDHPGVSSTHWLAVQFPDGPRYDLGLLEFFYLLFVCATFILAGRRRWPNGFFIGLFFALYGPVRFAMDTLRVSEARYLDWTPGQYLTLLATLFGVAMLVHALRRARSAVASAG